MMSNEQCPEHFASLSAGCASQGLLIETIKLVKKSMVLQVMN